MPAKNDVLQHESNSRYSFNDFSNHLKATWLETSLISLSVFAVGVSKWEWFSSDFTIENEGYFAADTYQGGADKLDHAYSGYAATSFLYQRLKRRNFQDSKALTSAVIVSQVIQTSIEIGDGTSKKYGASYEDLVMNVAGAAIAVAKHRYPDFGHKFDFRRSLVSNDPDQPRYFFVNKFSGYDFTKNNLLKHFEVHLGMDAYGFRKSERDGSNTGTQSLYFGIGINLKSLLFSQGSPNDSWFEGVLYDGMDIYQSPLHLSEPIYSKTSQLDD